VPEHDDLQLLELLRAKTQRSDLQNASETEIAKRPEQRRLLESDGTGARLYGSSRLNRSRTELTHSDNKLAPVAIVDRLGTPPIHKERRSVM
jgi:hypothetical protein